jgi:hypothetical protein
MAAMAIAALLFGAALGLRYNAWALLLCLGATVLVMSSVMLVSASPISSTALALILALTAMQIGFLAGSYAAEIGGIRSSRRSAPFVISQ